MFTIARSEMYRKTRQVWQPASATIQPLKRDVVFVARLLIDLSGLDAPVALEFCQASAAPRKLFERGKKKEPRIPPQQPCFSIRAQAYHFCVFFALHTFVSPSSTQIVAIDFPSSNHSPSTAFIKV